MAGRLRLRRQPRRQPRRDQHPGHLRLGRKGQPLCLIGDSGTGKSHLLIALGTTAAMAGFRVRYTLASKLANELAEAADDRQLTKTIARYGRAGLLCIDELGYMELDRRGAELLFQVLTEREETASVAIASNESFSGWTKPSPTPTSAPLSSTGSPSTPPSSRPAPSPTASTVPGPAPARPPPRRQPWPPARSRTAGTTPTTSSTTRRCGARRAPRHLARRRHRRHGPDRKPHRPGRTVAAAARARRPRQRARLGRDRPGLATSPAEARLRFDPESPVADGRWPYDV